MRVCMRATEARDGQRMEMGGFTCVHVCTCVCARVRDPACVRVTLCDRMLDQMERWMDGWIDRWIAK